MAGTRLDIDDDSVPDLGTANWEKRSFYLAMLAFVFAVTSGVFSILASREANQANANANALNQKLQSPVLVPRIQGEFQSRQQHAQNEYPSTWPVIVLENIGLSPATEIQVTVKKSSGEEFVGNFFPKGISQFAPIGAGGESRIPLPLSVRSDAGGRADYSQSFWGRMAQIVEDGTSFDDRYFDMEISYRSLGAEFGSGQQTVKNKVNWRVHITSEYSFFFLPK